MIKKHYSTEKRRASSQNFGVLLSSALSRESYGPQILDAEIFVVLLTGIPSMKTALTLVKCLGPGTINFGL